MSEENSEDKIILPHHEQQELCTTRLPYRQGRKLTAVKVYTINDESNHLVIFGVPSLNLRQEAKALFLKFGKLKSFSLSKQYKNEQFTETYHAVYEKIQSARVAKRMLDTKNFYGGSLHISYAPELEDEDETNTKLLQRRYDVLARLRNLKKEKDDIDKTKSVEHETEDEIVQQKVNMGEINIIQLDGTVRKLSHNAKRFKPCFISNEVEEEIEENIEKKRLKSVRKEVCEEKNVVKPTEYPDRIFNVECVDETNKEIVDCTSAEIETITNVDEHSKRKKDEIKVYKIPAKPLNKIQFNINKKT